MSVVNIQVQESRKKTIQSNTHYSRLIESVGAFGRYQKQLAAVVIISWFIAGLYQSALFVFYDMGDPYCPNALRKDLCIMEMCNEQTSGKAQDFSKFFPEPLQIPATIPYNLRIACSESKQFWISNVSNVSPIISLLLSGWIATKNGKKGLMIMLGLSLLSGTLALLFNKRSIAGVVIAQAFIGISYVPMSILLLTLTPELMTEKVTAWVIVLSLIGNRIGRIFMSGIFTSGGDMTLLTLAVLLPLCILYFTIHCYFYQSPRHLLDRNILKAFEVLKNIAHKNNSQYEQVDIENSFILSKINIRKYDYTNLFRHRSLRIQTYSYCMMMIMMGIISQYPSYVMEVRLDRSYQELAMASIQLISLLPCFLFISIYPRKTMSIVISLLLFILCFLLPFMGYISIQMYFMIRVAILGLACIALSILSVFLTVSIIETYPHTVRTLAMCLLYGCFLLGRFIEKIADYIADRQLVMEEMFAQTAFLLLFHMVAMRETKDSPFLYEIKELNDELQRDALFE